MAASKNSTHPYFIADSNIKVIAFDAVGTLIYAEPSVSATYCRILGDLCARPVDVSKVRKVLGMRLAERSRQDDLRTSEAAERGFWFDLIAELVPDENHVDECFEALYEHFGLASNWRCYGDVAETLTALKSSGLKLVLASNFDERLRAVCGGLPELENISGVIISSEVGWRKPAPEFFEVVCQQTDCRLEEILFVGDDILNDVQGAEQAGMFAAWLDRKGQPPGAVLSEQDRQIETSAWQIHSLRELIPGL